MNYEGVVLDEGEFFEIPFNGPKATEIVSTPLDEERIFEMLSSLLRPPEKGVRGGPGSGHHGHKGRPGQVGGSLPSGAPEVEIVDYTEDEAFNTAAKMDKVISSNPLDDGYCRAEILEYADDGSGIWKALTKGDHDGNSEVAAYRISELLGMDIVPETVYAMHNVQLGTSQRFIPDVEVGWDYIKKQIWRTEDPAELWAKHGERVTQTIMLDYIIGNQDRHNGNWMIAGDARFWAVDHGHSTWRRLLPSEADYVVNTSLDYVFNKDQGYVSLSQGTIRQWSKITRNDWDRALGGIAQDNRVNFDNAWDNFQDVIKGKGLNWKDVGD